MKHFTHLLLSTVFFAGLTASAFAQQDAAKTDGTKTIPVKPPGVGKYDTHLPVEISSDNLEVLQKENKAIFRGNVIAVQGQLRLNADKMTVHYKQKSETGAPGSAPAPVPAPTPAPTTTTGAVTPAPAGDMGAITHIETEGHVLFVTPEETAEGDRGDYDVATRYLKLIGDNVVLTRDGNILRGKAVDYNLDTGRSVMTTGDDAQKGKGDSRVRGVFIPKSTPKSTPKGTPAAAPAATPAPTPAPTMVPQTDSSGKN